MIALYLYGVDGLVYRPSSEGLPIIEVLEFSAFQTRYLDGTEIPREWLIVCSYHVPNVMITTSAPFFRSPKGLDKDLEDAV